MRDALTCLACLLWVSVLFSPALADHAEPETKPGARLEPYPDSELNLATVPFKIVYETLRETEGKEEVPVGKRRYERTDPPQWITISTKPGWLNFEWVYHLRVEEEAGAS